MRRSSQVLQEFYVQVTRSSLVDARDRHTAPGLMESFTRFPVQAITWPIFQAALRTTARCGLAYCDSAIIEAAHHLGCGEVPSEDLPHGQEYAGVTVLNAFAGA